MTETSLPLDNRQWIAKILAAILPGLGLVFAIMAILGQLAGTTGDPRTLSAQALMWLTAFLWVVVIGICFLFPTGRRAWAVFGSACAVLWGCFLLMRAFQP